MAVSLYIFRGNNSHSVRTALERRKDALSLSEPKYERLSPSSLSDCLSSSDFIWSTLTFSPS